MRTNSQRRRRRLFVPLPLFALAGCASFTVLQPGSNATVPSPATTDIYWNADLQPGTLKVTVDQADVTGQFSVPSTAANGHATASLALANGAHTVSVTGNLATNGGFSAQSASQSFTVSSTGQPVTYTETILNHTPGWPQGTLGSLAFGGTSPHPNVNLVFVFEGNTADVVPFHVPASCGSNCPGFKDGDGFEIIAGTARVKVVDAASGDTLAEGTFIPAAGVFVSTDNGNHGLGFGCFGALPGAPTFPNNGVEVAYPYALMGTQTTDLKTNFNTNSVTALSCQGFSHSPGTKGPGSCNLPSGLGTTAGILTVTANDQEDSASGVQHAGTFQTELH